MKKKLSSKQEIMAYVLNTDADLNANKKNTQSQQEEYYYAQDMTMFPRKILKLYVHLNIIICLIHRSYYLI